MRDTGQSRNEIRISNRATYWTVAPLDMLVAAPLVGRLLLGATPLGRLVQGVVLFGFTNFLYTFETTASARQIAPPAGTLHQLARMTLRIPCAWQEPAKRVESKHLAWHRSPSLEPSMDGPGRGAASGCCPGSAPGG